MTQHLTKSKSQSFQQSIQVINYQFFKAAQLLSTLEPGNRNMVALLGEEQQCTVIFNKLQAQQLDVIYDQHKLEISVNPVNKKQKNSFLELGMSSNKQIIFHSLQNILPVKEIHQNKKLLLKKIIFYDLLKLCDMVAFYVILNYNSGQLDLYDFKLISDSYTQLCENFKCEDGYNIVLQIDFIDIQKIENKLETFLMEQLEKNFSKNLDEDKKLKIRSQILKENKVILQKLKTKFIMSQAKEQNINQFSKQYLIFHQKLQTKLRQQYPTYFLPQKQSKNEKQLKQQIWNKDSNKTISQFNLFYKRLTAQIQVKFVENVQKVKEEIEESYKKTENHEFNLKIFKKISQLLDKPYKQISQNQLISVVKKITLPIFNQDTNSWEFDLKQNTNQKKLFNFVQQKFDEAQEKLKKNKQLKKMFQQENYQHYQKFKDIVSIFKYLFSEKREDSFYNNTQKRQLKLLEDLISSTNYISNNKKQLLTAHQNIVLQGLQILKALGHLLHSQKPQIQQESYQCSICGLQLDQAKIYIIQKKFKTILSLSQIVEQNEFSLKEIDTLKCNNRIENALNFLGSFKEYSKQDLDYFKDILTFKIQNPKGKSYSKLITQKVRQLQFFYSKCSKMLIFLNFSIIFNMKIIQIISKNDQQEESKYIQLKNEICNLYNDPSKNEYLDLKKRLQNYTKLNPNTNVFIQQTKKIFNESISFVIDQQSFKNKKKYRTCLAFIKIILKSQRQYQNNHEFYQQINQYQFETKNHAIYSIMCKIELFFGNISDFQKYYDLALQKRAFQTYDELQKLIIQLGAVNQTALQQKVRNFIIFKKASPQQNLSKLIQKYELIKKQGKVQDKISFREKQIWFLNQYTNKMKDKQQEWRIKQILQKCNLVFFGIKKAKQYKKIQVNLQEQIEEL